MGIGHTMYLLDTNIISFFLRGNYPALNERILDCVADDLAISIISAGELYYGVQRLAPSQRAKQLLVQLKDFTQAVSVHALPVNAAQHYGTIKTHLHAAGRPIGGNDLWIAAHALADKRILVTNNTREFERVPNLIVEDWTKV